MKTGYTAAEIAATLGISRQAVIKRLGDEWLIGYANNSRGSGRSMKVYKATALNLWAKEELFVEKKDNRRKHYGAVQNKRGRGNLELINYVTKIAFKLYMQDALGDVRSAARRAISETFRNIENGIVNFNADELQKIKENEWLYKQWIMRSDKFRKGVFYTEFWAKHWETNNKVHTSALSVATNKNDAWRIYENSFGATKGYGAYRFIMLDDRNTDSWTKDIEGFSMPYAIYAWDTLTGELLHIEPVETAVNSEHYISAILNVIYKYGCDCPVFFMENARAAIAYNVQGTVKALYSDADLQLLNSDNYRKLTHGNIIARNVPNIPKGFGKGRGENLFQELKSAEAYLFPRNFKGGNRNEQIELHRHNRPVLGSYTPDREKHFAALWKYAQGEMLDKTRDNLRNWAKLHNSEPTMRAFIEYYRPAEIKYPSPDQTALLIYYADRKTNEVKLSATGQIRVTREGLQHNLVAPELFLIDKKTKLQVKPVSVSKDANGYYAEWIIYKVNGKNELPTVVCFAKNYVATTIHESHANAIEIRRMREDYFAKFKTKIDYTHSEQKVKQLTDNTILVTDESTVIDVTDNYEVIIDENEEDIDALLRESNKF